MSELTTVPSVPEKLLSWPTPQDYNEAVQTPALCFADQELKQGRADVNEFGLPRPISGGFASVYRIRAGSRELAVRCFLSRLQDRQMRYEAISKYIQEQMPPWAVPFEFVADGINIDGQSYPIVKMEWVRGMTLGNWLESCLDQPQRIRAVHNKLRCLVLEFQSNGIAHGDLQPGNIIVVEGDDLRLVDYDGMYVPELAGFEANELGHRNYQHPERRPEHFNNRLDNFSAWLLCCALEILAEAPELWKELGCGDDAVLFRQDDLADPDHSYAFSVLEAHENPRVRELAKLVRTLSRNPLYLVPQLSQPPAIDNDLPAVAYTPKPAIPLPQLPPQPIPRHRKSGKKARRQVNQPPKVTMSIATDLHSTNRYFLYPTIGCIGLLLAAVIGISILGPHRLFSMQNITRAPGLALFDAAHSNMGSNPAQSAKMFDEIIRRYREPKFGLDIDDVLESVIHRAELARSMNDATAATRFIAQGRAIWKDTIDRGIETDYLSSDFVFEDALNTAARGDLDGGVQGLIAFLDQDESFFDAESNREIISLVRTESARDLDAALSLWSKWREHAGDSDKSMIDQEIDAPLFQIAHEYAVGGKPDYDKAYRVYAALNEVLGLPESIVERIHAVEGMYYCRLKGGNRKNANRKDANYLERELRELNPTLTDSDFERIRLGNLYWPETPY